MVFFSLKMSLELKIDLYKETLLLSNNNTVKLVKLFFYSML